MRTLENKKNNKTTTTKNVIARILGKRCSDTVLKVCYIWKQ